MQRITFLLLGMCLIFASYAQDLPAKLEKGLINYSYDSTFALIQKGKKTGLYNLTSNQFEIPFDKNGKLLARLDGRFFLGGEEMAEKYLVSKGVLKKTCDSDSASVEHCYEFNTTSSGEIIINLFEVPANWNGDEYGMDLVPDYANGIQSAGVYDPNRMKWVLPNEFMAVYPYKDMLFAITLDSEFVDVDRHLRYVFTYHIYQRIADKYEVVKEVSKFDNSDLVEIMNLDSIKKTEMDDQVFYTFKDKKIGILYSDLNRSSLHQDYRLQLQEVIPPTYDFIYQISDRSFIGYQAQPVKGFKYFEIGVDEHYDYVSKNERKEFPAITANLIGDVRVPKVVQMMGDTIDIVGELTQNMGQYGGRKGLEYINDSLIKIVNNNEGFYEAVASTVWVDEDSIDANGETVYILEGQSLNTGVYNIKRNKWEVQPMYRNAHFAGDHWFVQQVMEVQDENTYRPKEEVVILDMDLSKLGSLDEDFYSTGRYLANLFPPNTYSIFNRFGSFDIYQEFIGLHPVCTGLKSNGKMDLFAPRTSNFTPYIIKENVDFAYADPECYVTSWVNSDSISLSFFDTTYQISGADCELIFDYTSNWRGAIYSVIEIVGSDTTQHHGKYADGSGGSEYKNRISLQLKGDELIVNSRPTVSSEIIDPEYYEPMGWMTQEFAQSAIWQRTSQGFIRQTPYYADVKPLPMGYIVSTPSYASAPSWTGISDQYPEQWYEEEKRFLWLDDSLKAIEFVDFFDFELIEDLGFGIAVKTDKGCMFTTYEGQMITSDEWEEFSIEKGRLRAFHSGLIRDENGEPKLDETGEYMYTKEPVTEYFDLPK